MAKDGKTKTVAAIVICAITVAGTWTGFIIAGNNVKNTAVGAKESVVELKKDGCDPANDTDRRCLVLETQWKTINVSQQKIDVKIDKTLDGQRMILEELRK